MNRIKSLVVHALASAPLLILSLPAFAGGGGGGGGTGGSGTSAPEPAFLTMCAIVAGTELGRRVIKNRKNNDS